MKRFNSDDVIAMVMAAAWLTIVGAVAYWAAHPKDKFRNQPVELR